MQVRSWHWAIAGLALGLSLAACGTTRPDGVRGLPASRPPSPGEPPKPSEPAPAITAGGFSTSGDSLFDGWRDQFAARAIAMGRQEQVVRAVLDGLVPVAQTAQAQSFDNQAEFVKPIWDYATTAVNPTRIANGRAKMALDPVMFDAIEAAYGVPREILAAIWGMETSYGANIGRDDAPRVIASQAAIGRRRDFNENELLAVMQLIEKGWASRDQFRRASFAGAIGQTQFMPSTVLAFGQDFDRDGKEDLWGNSADALASAANYLARMGWTRGEPWALEARLTSGFDYSLGDGRKLTIAAWRAAGATPAGALPAPLDDALNAELFLPAGSHGPVFLLFDNFAVIKRYNNADSYALAVGLLADRLAGQPALSRPWPTDLVMLTQQQAKDLQAALNSLGFSAGAVDGIIGRGTRGALQRFQKSRGLLADGFPTIDMLAEVSAAAKAG